jgi:hypothetical protein
MNDIDKQWNDLFGQSNHSKKGNYREKPVTKKRIAVKKYTQNGNGKLFESVVIGGRRTFVYLNKRKEPQFIEQINRINDILLPDDSIDTQNPIPFLFETKEELERYFEKVKKLSLDTIFSLVQSINRKYVDVEDHYHVLLAADMIWTWFQDKFGYTHYNLIVGDNGSGKNSQLLVLRYLGYRVFYAVSASAANYYTKMGNVEEGQITLAEDEAEDIANDRQKRNVWKSGYSSGGTVPKVELDGGRKSEDWLTYCQKWAAMEELPSNKDIKGVLDRSFVFKFVAGNPQYNIKDVIKTAGDPKFKPLFDELIDTRKILFCWRLLHYEDPILDVTLNVKNRSAELTKGLIRLFANSPFALQAIIDSLSKFMIERSETKKNSFESKLFDVICSLKEERKQRLDSGIATDDEISLGYTTFTNPALINIAKVVMECVETDKNGLYWSSLLSIMVSQAKITSLAKSKFRAEALSKKIEGKTVRCLKFEEKYLDRIKANYDIPDKLTLVTAVTHPTSVQRLYNDMVNAKIRADIAKFFENTNRKP